MHVKVYVALHVKVCVILDVNNSNAVENLVLWLWAYKLNQCLANKTGTKVLLRAVDALQTQYQ